jgi:uncharacterized membrane protein YkvA (DUF1232 family)
MGRLLTNFRKELLLAWAVLRDPRSPRAAKLVTVLAALYIVSPIDFVPDTIPILGWLDDGLIGFCCCNWLSGFCRPSFWHHCANAWAPSSVRSQSLQP